MKRLLGFVLGAAVGVLLVRYHILDGGEIQATRNSLDALALGLWSEAAKLVGNSAALKLGAGLLVGGVLGTAIQYMVERQVHMGRR
jgi:hypothetical protein